MNYTSMNYYFLAIKAIKSIFNKYDDKDRKDNSPTDSPFISLSASEREEKEVRNNIFGVSVKIKKPSIECCYLCPCNGVGHILPFWWV